MESKRRADSKTAHSVSGGPQHPGRQGYNAFSAFPDDALVRISPDEIRKKGRVPKNGSIFFTIFQTFMSGRDAEGNPAPNFEDYPSLKGPSYRRPPSASRLLHKTPI
jgi:hypothetical protein